MLTTLAELDERIAGRDEPVEIAVVCANDVDALESLAALTEGGIIRPLLIDPNPGLAHLAATHLPEGSYDAIQVTDEKEAARAGVTLVREGRAHALMKGHVSSGVFLKAVVDREEGIRASRLLSHVAVIEATNLDHLIAVTDGGMVAVPTAEQLEEIISHGCDVIRQLGNPSPKVALLSAAETPIPHLASAAMQMELAAKEGRDVVVEGPISLDIALVPGVGEEKGYKGEIKGDASVVVAPDIVTGNALAKAFIYFGGGAMAGIVIGASCPIILTSRSATADEKRRSIELAILFGGR